MPVPYLPVGARLSAFIGDGPTDPDRNPDLVRAVEGKLTLTPVTREVVLSEDGVSTIVATPPLVGQIGPDGWVQWPHGMDGDLPEGTPPHIVVVDLTDEALTPNVTSGATHTMTIAGAKTSEGVALEFPRSGQRVRLTADRVDPELGIINLADQTTASPPAIVQVLQGDKGDKGDPGDLSPEGMAASAAAVQAAEDAAQAVTDAEAARDEAVAPVESGLSWSGPVSLAARVTPCVLHAELVGNTVVELAAPPADRAFTITLILTQDATGGRTIGFTGAVAAWGVPLEARGPGEVSLVHLLADGTRWWALDGAANASVPAGWA